MMSLHDLCFSDRIEAER
uniref:Uncharacterized protein n=1 Tax=Arundo donax TaxID=35708 RepID=A0A0A9EPZ6_ARUDO